MSTITSDDPTTRRALDRLRHALARLDDDLRRDLHTVVANPARVGAAGLTAGVYVLGAAQRTRWVCPTTAVLLHRGETTWAALAACEAAKCFDALRDTATFNDLTASGAALEDFNSALDEFMDRPGWAKDGAGPDPDRRAAVATELQGLLLRLLAEVDGGWW
jgi:hypothetical protein